MNIFIFVFGSEFDIRVTLTCSKEVSGGCSALGKTFHKECFKCSNCKEKLENRFFSAEDKPFCERCYKVSKDFST